MGILTCKIEGCIYDRQEDEMIIVMTHACSHHLTDHVFAALEKDAQAASKKS